MIERATPEPHSTAELLEDRVVSLSPVGQRPARADGRWVLLAAGLVVVLGAAFLAARPPGPPLAAVASASAPTSELAPTPVLPTADSGPCGTGRIEVDPMIEPKVAEEMGRIAPPTGGLLATAVERDSSGGSVVVSQARADGRSDARVVATFHGSAIQAPFGVTVVGWSAAGDRMLVRTAHESLTSGDSSCADLFIVYADGSGVQYLTGSGVRAWIAAAALAPRTGVIAYVEGDHLWVADAEAPNDRVAVSPCPGAAPTIRWSPDERRLLAFCEGSLLVADASGATGLFPIQPGTTPMSAVWSADSKSITLVSDNGAGGSSSIGPLAVLDVDPATGVGTKRVETEKQTEWTVPSPFISPDGHWLLAEGVVLGHDYAEFTAVDLTTGATTPVPWPILPGVVGQESFAWLPDNETMLYADNGILYALNVRAMTRTEVGSVPTPDFAWVNRAP